MKTENDVRSLLRDAAGQYQTGLPPTPLVIDRGRRAKKRRVTWLAGLAAACVIAAAAVGGLLVRPGSEPHTVAPIDATDSTVGTETTEPTTEELVHVPAIRGLREGHAGRELQLLGLKMVVNELPTECPDAEKVVVGQDPVVGRSVPTGSKVYVNVGVLVCGLSAADRRVVEEFEQFAADPSAGGPFAPSVALGLGNELRRVITRADQTDPSQWRLDLTGYAERAGELSVLDLVADNADIETLTTDVRPSFCPTTLAEQPPPQLTGGGHAVRIRMLQPPGACMQLATVDLYVNDANEVVGVNVGLGAP